MKKRFIRFGFLVLLALSLLLSIHSCNKENELEPVIPSPVSNGQNWGSAKQIAISGQVFDESNQPLNGVTVKAGNQTTTTDANGVFSFNSAPVLDRLGYITASKQGYFPGSRTFLPTAGKNVVKVTMLQKNLAGSIDASAGGTMQREGVTVSFAAGSFTKNGAAYSGQVNVALNFIDPESANFDSEMPGALLGLMGTTPNVLTSYGMVAVELTDDAGNKLELANRKTAQVRFPIPASMQASAPVEIDLWYFDEPTGLWKNEGKASKQGNEYIANIAHFSFWNCDFPVPFIELSGQIVTESGVGIPNALVTVSSSTFGSQSDYTSSSGHFGGFVPNDELLTISVELNCGGTGSYQEVYTAQIGPLTSSTTLAPIQIPSSTLTIVTGTLVGCDNAPLSNGYIIANGRAYFPDLAGQFSILTCGNNLTLKSFASTPWTSGQTITLTLNGGNLDAGILEVCNTVAGNTIIDIDGNEYTTVVIGTQEWMAENLKTTRYANGDSIPNVIETLGWFTLTTGAWCNYENNSVNDLIYGKLYNWYTVIDPRNVCPTGWHTPDNNDFNLLINYLGGEFVAGGKLKAINLWESPNIGATNESGFSGLPGGGRNHYVDDLPFYNLGTMTMWWSASIDFVGLQSAFQFGLSFEDGFAHKEIIGYKKDAFSIRCLKD
jgi:uncharacterized protein (TIGR02145 family)